jgi:hypothetical protein
MPKKRATKYLKSGSNTFLKVPKVELALFVSELSAEIMPDFNEDGSYSLPAIRVAVC